MADPGQSDGFLGERVASVYEERTAAMFDSAVVEPAASLLAELAGHGPALDPFGQQGAGEALPLEGLAHRIGSTTPTF